MAIAANTEQATGDMSSEEARARFSGVRTDL